MLTREDASQRQARDPPPARTDAMTEARLMLCETTISGRSVRVRLADHVNPAYEWIDIQVVPHELVLADGNLSHGADHTPLAAFRLAALRRAQAAIAGEIARLSKSFENQA